MIDIINENQKYSENLKNIDVKFKYNIIHWLL